jgi:hypothetical protein
MMTKHAIEYTLVAARARTAAHRRRRGELPGVWVPQEYPVSEYAVAASTLRVPREYPIRTAILRVGTALPSTAHKFPTNTAASTRSTFAAAVSTPFEHPC